MFRLRRRDPRRSLLTAALLSFALLSTVLIGAPAAQADPSVPRPAKAQAAAGVEPYSVLVFSETAGFRHGSIPAGIAAVQRLGADNGFTVDATEDGAAFTDANLAKYRAVIWLSTTGDVLDPGQQAAFERYIKAGGGYAGWTRWSDWYSPPPPRVDGRPGHLQLEPAGEGQGFYTSGPILAPGDWRVTVRAPAPHNGKATVEVADIALARAGFCGTCRPRRVALSLEPVPSSSSHGYLSV